MTARTMRFERFWFHQKIFIFREDTDEKLPIAEKVCTFFKRVVNIILSSLEASLNNLLNRVWYFWHLPPLHPSHPSPEWDTGSSPSQRGDDRLRRESFPPREATLVIEEITEASRLGIPRIQQLHCQMSTMDFMSFRNILLNMWRRKHFWKTCKLFPWWVVFRL